MAKDKCMDCGAEIDTSEGSICSKCGHARWQVARRQENGEYATGYEAEVDFWRRRAEAERKQKAEP